MICNHCGKQQRGIRQGGKVVITFIGRTFYCDDCLVVK